MARIIGVVAATLLLGSSAFGQFMVQPMKVVVQAPPGKRTPVQVVIENNNRSAIQQVDVRITDMLQDENGQWQSLEPDVPITKDSDGAQWVTVSDSETGAPRRVNITKLRRCQSWLRLLRDTMTISPMQRQSVHLFVDVPASARGFYCAALLAESPIGSQDIEGLSTGLAIQFLVPIIVEVQGRPERHKVDLTDVDLQLVQSITGQAVPVVSLKVKNDGGTYSQLNAYARIWRQFGGRWQKLTDVAFGEGSIIPGAEYFIRTSAGIPLPGGEYKVQGYLHVDGMPGAEITKELSFKGDPRVRNVKPVAGIDLNPRELSITTSPGQPRVGSVVVANAAEDPITVTVTPVLPRHMFNTVAGSIRGDQFDCAEWLEVSPTQFTLEGGGRTTLRVLANMPASATGANYYAMIQLHATYRDGLEAGKTDCRVCITNKLTQNSTLIQPFPITLGELAPGRYAVTAKFLNAGDTHIMPACRAVLTNANGEKLKEFGLESDILNQSGILLPLESRIFGGVLDMAGMNPGLYRLRAVLTYGRGTENMVQQQAGLEVIETPEGKVIKVIPVDGMPAESVPVKL